MNFQQMILNQVMGGMNPVEALQKAGMMNPQIATALNVLNGKTPQQIQTIAENMCRERGTTPQEVARSLGLIK